MITPSQIRYVHYYNSIIQGSFSLAYVSYIRTVNPTGGISTGEKPEPRGQEKKLVLEQIVMEPCPVIPGTEEKGIAGSWTPVVQICTLQGMLLV